MLSSVVMAEMTGHAFCFQKFVLKLPTPAGLHTLITQGRSGDISGKASSCCPTQPSRAHGHAVHLLPAIRALRQVWSLHPGFCPHMEFPADDWNRPSLSPPTNAVGDKHTKISRDIFITRNPLRLFSGVREPLSTLARKGPLLSPSCPTWNASWGTKLG